MVTSRHQAAKIAWQKLVDSGRADDIRRRMGKVEDSRIKAAECVHFYEGDLFGIDISDATHIYTSSLCFTDEMMVDLASKLNIERLQGYSASRRCNLSHLDHYLASSTRQWNL